MERLINLIISLDWKTFIPTLLATFIGVGLAFLLNKIYNNKTEKRQARRILFLLRDEIASNNNLLLQLKEEIQTSNYTPFYDLRFVVWNSVPSKISTILTKLKVLSDIAKFYYELQHINRKINGVFNLSYHPNTGQGYTRELRQQLITSLQLHVPGILEGKNCKSPKEIIEEINNLIEELK
jgi:hypothetical protein